MAPMPETSPAVDTRLKLLLSSRSAIDMVKLGELIRQRQQDKDTSPAPAPSRAARRQEIAARRALTDTEREDLAHLAQVVGVLPLAVDPTDLDETDTSILLDEYKAIQQIQDTVEGRRAAVRAAVFAAMDARYGIEETEPASLPSTALGYRFSREISGGKPNINWAGLATVVPPQVWKKIARKVVTDRVTYTLDGQEVAREGSMEYTVDEAAVLEAMKNDEITLDHIVEVTTFSKKIASLHVRDLTSD